MSAERKPPSARAWLGLLALLALVWAASSGLRAWQDERTAATVCQHAQRVDITLYTTSTCPYCAQAIAWLKRHGVRWRECNIDLDSRCRLTYEQQGSPGVPLVQAGARWQLGFQAPRLAQALAEQDAQVQSDSPKGASAPLP